MDPTGKSSVPVLSQFGEPTVYKRELSSGEDRLNHQQTTWQNEGTTLAARYYPENQEEETMVSGSHDTNKPLFIIERGSGIEDGDRLFYGGSSFVIDALTHKRAYIIAETTEY
jgi:hypothetical protein